MLKSLIRIPSVQTKKKDLKKLFGVSDLQKRNYNRRIY